LYIQCIYYGNNGCKLGKQSWSKNTKGVFRRGGISQGSKVDITFKDGRLIIEPVKEEEKSLKELLSTVTKNNLHGEVETDVQGEEVW
jgi:antitoxin component of MazEF toxin-antitoxin module